MSPRKLSRNAPCPCGSGKKYEHCCLHKDFEWLEDEEGNVFKSLPISPEMIDMLEEQRQAFVAKHGREPGPDDPLFPDMPHLEHMEHEMIQIMKKAGIDPAIIHAVEKTGRLVSEENRRFLSDVELEEWEAAIEEYYELNPESEDPPKYPIGTVALYGPDDKTTTKIVAGVILQEDAEAIIERWVGTDVTTNPQIQQGIAEFFDQHGVKSVVTSDQNIGCPHEEGEDSPWAKTAPSARIGRESREVTRCFDQPGIRPIRDCTIARLPEVRRSAHRPTS